MKKTNVKISVILIVVIFIGATFSLTSCKKKVAPVLPPQGTFVLEEMSDNSKTMETDLVNSNAPHAFFNVAVWTTITSVAMLVPVTAYKHALKQEPTHVSGDKWVWEYQIDVGFKKYTVQLYGETKNDVVEWELHTSLSGEFEDFVWFTGTQNVEGSAGQWIVNKSHIHNTPFIQIDWTYDNVKERGTLKYTNIEEGYENKGAYIYYGNNQNGAYDAFYDIFDKKDNNLIEIDYNTVSHIGRVKNFDFYEDDLWHCWNEKFKDIVCETTAK